MEVEKLPKIEQLTKPNFEIITVKTNPMITNCYVVFDRITKEAAVVDFACFDDDLIQIIQKNKLFLKFIFLTHGHFDHIMGVKQALETLNKNCKIIISKEDAEIVNDCEKNASIFLGLNVKLELNSTNLNTITFEGEPENFELTKNLKFKTIATPGHTAGSCSFLLNNEIIFTGDALFNGSVGRTDLFSGSDKQTSQTIAKFKTLPKNLLVLPGHGPKTTLADEFLNNPNFK